jgi:phytoene dehydrogenase-like protein
LSEPAKYWIEQTEPWGHLDKLGCRAALWPIHLPSVLIGVLPRPVPSSSHHALASYLFSAWRLGTNGAHMADVCARRLAALGGTVRTGDAVAGIRTADGCVQGVTLASGERIDAALVIGTLHHKTMVGLLAPESIKPTASASWA